MTGSHWILCRQSRLESALSAPLPSLWYLSGYTEGILQPADAMVHGERRFEKLLIAQLT